MALVPWGRSDDPKWRVSSGQPSFGEPLADFVNPYTGVPTEPTDGHSIPVEWYPLKDNTTVRIGELVYLDENDELVRGAEGGALGVAMGAATSGETGILFNPTSIPVALAKYTDPDSGSIVKTRFLIGGHTTTGPSTVHIGTSYAVTLTLGTVAGHTGFGNLVVATPANQLTVVGIDLNRNFVNPVDLVVQGCWIVELHDSFIQS